MVEIGELVQNRYEVIEVIGEGGFGRVFEVIDRRDSGKSKVLKVLNLGRFSDEESRETAINLFRREAEILQELSSSANGYKLAVPKVEADGYFVNEPDSSHCLVMEKIMGKNLKEIIDQKFIRWQCYQPISEQRAINWLKQLIGILDELHSRNFSHRDIKPDNIIERPNGKLVLIDFGAVKDYTSTYLASIGQREPETRIISPGYTPDEQADGFPQPRSDFFALSRTFVHLLTGIHPHDLLVTNGSTIPLTENTQITPQIRWRDKRPEISESLADLIDRMMDYNIDDRPRDVQEIREKLEEIERHNIRKSWYWLECLESWLPKSSVPYLAGINLLLVVILGVTGSLWLKSYFQSQPPNNNSSNNIWEIEDF